MLHSPKFCQRWDPIGIQSRIAEMENDAQWNRPTIKKNESNYQNLKRRERQTDHISEGANDEGKRGESMVFGHNQIGNDWRCAYSKSKIKI